MKIPFFFFGTNPANFRAFTHGPGAGFRETYYQLVPPDQPGHKRHKIELYNLLKNIRSLRKYAHPPDQDTLRHVGKY
jgi:hypothetical protein